MRKRSQSAFTLLEMMAVVAIIVVLVSLVLGVAGYATRRSAQARAAGEIKMLESGCENYKSDNGSYPQEVLPAPPGQDPPKGVTDSLEPKTHFSPTAPEYARASLFLYKELTGDKVGPGGSGGAPDGQPDVGAQVYLKDIDQRIIKATRNPNTKSIIAVQYFQDPFGFPYGYSTAAAYKEQKFKAELIKYNAGIVKTEPKRATGNDMPGFNSGSFDLWSTGGNNPTTKPTTDNAMELEWAKWLKNW
jgi:prepilin-type N-terminal cleavage/methylation domain-containing protein